ncbi:MAG: hypothetical protein KY455_00260 [Euryarchaeota archaeon]|nr:hypothetical protein [Euryarchaeota archaeon]
MAGKTRHRLSFLVTLLMVLMVVPAPADAQTGDRSQIMLLEFHGPAEISSGASFHVPDAPHPHLCARVEGQDAFAIMAQDGSLVMYETGGTGAACRDLPGSGVYHAVDDVRLRVVAFMLPPIEASNPGVTVLVGRGAGVLLPGLSPERSVGVNVDPGWRATVLDLGDLSVVGRIEGPKEVGGLAIGREGAWSSRTIVVVDEAGRTGDVRVAWEDPLWFRPEPTIGHMGVVVAMSLFLVFYRPPRP